MANSELKPCRVCRRNDELLVIPCEKYVTVFCDRCGASLSNTGSKPATAEEAIAAWNRDSEETK